MRETVTTRRATCWRWRWMMSDAPEWSEQNLHMRFSVSRHLRTLSTAPSSSQMALNSCCMSSMASLKTPTCFARIASSLLINSWASASTLRLRASASFTIAPSTACMPRHNHFANYLVAGVIHQENEDACGVRRPSTLWDRSIVSDAIPLLQQRCRPIYIYTILRWFKLTV